MTRTVLFSDLFFKQLSCFKKLQLLIGDGHYWGFESCNIYSRRKEEIIDDVDKNKENYKSTAAEGVLCFLIPYEFRAKYMNSFILGVCVCVYIDDL